MLKPGHNDYDLATYLTPEQEPNNTPDKSTLLTVGFNTYEYDDPEETLRGVFGMKGNISEADEDWFVISMEKGMVMRFTDGLMNLRADLKFTLFSLSPGLLQT